MLRADAPTSTASSERLRSALDFTVSGVVRGADDRQTLPGVNILVKGTTIGVATGLDGEYELTAPTELDTLVFSYIGYETQEVPIIGRPVIDVQLRPENYGGDEIVVIGYGSREVRDLTGSVGAVTTEEIEGKPLTSFEDALAGRVAGVQVQQNSGDQIGNFSVDIRGVGSFSGSNRPLYVVDGIPLEPTDVAFLSTLNTDDIESISVLKDASSASIYGTRAADGVVIITTKTGAGKAPQVRVSSTVGIAQPVGQIEMLNSEQLAQFRYESVRNQQADRGSEPTFELPDPLQDPAFLAANDVNWQDVLTRDALEQRYSVNALGSSGPIQYSASGAYEIDEGTLIGTDITKASVRLNTVTNLSSRATLDTRLTGARQWGSVRINDQTFGAAFRDGLYKYPWEQPYNPDGTFAEYDRGDPDFGPIYSQPFPQNPAADLLENTRTRQWQQFVGSVAFTYQLPLSLRYRGSGSANISRNNANDFFPIRDRARQERETTRALTFDQSGFNYFTDHTLTFDREVGKHDIEILGGMSYQENYLEFTFIEAFGGNNNRQREISQQPEIKSATRARQQSQILLSYFSRADYDFNDKYFVTATVRRDGSSKFAPGNKWGVFPAISFAWRASSEPFLKNVRAIDDLRFRTSYGELGDKDIGDLEFLNLISYGFVGFGDDATRSAAPANIATTDLRWETVRQFDFGMDLSLFRGRIDLTADLYNRETVDVLADVGVLAAFPVGSISANIGTVQNRGFELGLSTVPVRGDAVTWRLGATFGYNENEVLEIGERVLGESLSLPGRGLDGPLRGGAVNRTEVGQPIGVFYLWEFVGICGTDQYDADANTCAGITGLRPGDTIYRDLNGDGVIDDDDRSYQGQGLPKMFGGITSSLQLGPVGIETLFTYALGRKLLDTQYMFGISGDSNINKRIDVLDRWTPDNQDTDIPRAVQGGRGYDNVRASTFFLQNADFLRLRQLTVSYKLPTRFAALAGASRAEIALVGTNLFTFTGYSGINPEASSGRKTGSGNIDAASNPRSPGLDFTTYPLSRTISARVTVTL